MQAMLRVRTSTVKMARHPVCCMHQIEMCLFKIGADITKRIFSIDGDMGTP